MTKARRSSEIDRAAKAFGMPMGPITLYDVVGLDVAVHAGRRCSRRFPIASCRRQFCRRWSTPAGSVRKWAAGSSTTAGEGRQAAARHG